MTLSRRNSGKRIAKTRSLVSRRLSRSLPYYLTPEKAHALIDSTTIERDRILLRLGDVGMEGIRVLGKGGFERVVFVQDGLVSSILIYAQERRMDRGDYLFTSRKGGQITKQRADQIIRNAQPRVPGYGAMSMRTYSDKGMPSTSSTAAVAWMRCRSNWATRTSTLHASTCAFRRGCETRGGQDAVLVDVTGLREC